MKRLLALVFAGLLLVSPVYGLEGKLVTNNSSDTALDNGASFTGKPIYVGNYPSITVAVLTDQSGKLYIQQSPDGNNWDSTLTYDVAASSNDVHRLTITRPFARVTYTNDSGSNQTYFRLTTLLGEQSHLTSTLSSVVQQDSDAQVVRPTDFRYEIAQSRYQNHTLWNKFGYNTDIDTTTDPEVLASWGGTFQYITAGETIDVVSSSTSDDSGSTGVNSIIVWGVDENWQQQTEIITMDGTTTVTTTSQWIGINRVSIYTTGSGTSNVGNITVTSTSTGHTMAVMPAGEGTTQMCVFYVAADYSFLAD